MASLVTPSAGRSTRWRGAESTSAVGRPGFVVGTILALYGVFQLAGQYEPVLFLHDAEFMIVAATAMVTGAVVSGIGAGRHLRRQVADSGAWVRALVGPALVGVGYLLVAVVGLRLIGGSGWPDLPETIAVPVEVLAGTAAGLSVGAAAWRLPPWMTGTTAAVLAVPVAIGSLVVAGSGPWSGVRGGATECSQRGEVEYCAYPGYPGSYPARWQAVVEPVLAAAPRDVAAGPWRVLQDAEEDWIPGTLATTGRAWGRGVGVRYAVAGTALQVGDVLAGATTEVECPGVHFRARVVAALWLAGQAGPDVREYLASDDLSADAITGSQMAATPPVVGSLEERHAAARLLGADTSAVRRYIHANWQSLTDAPCAPATDLLDRFTP